MSQAAEPTTLIAIQYVIATCYFVGMFTLAYCVWIALDKYLKAEFVPGKLLAALWFGFALFLGGCGWHHIQHAQHLRAHYELATTAAYWSAWAQIIGAILAIASSGVITSRVSSIRKESE